LYESLLLAAHFDCQTIAANGTAIRAGQSQARPRYNVVKSVQENMVARDGIEAPTAEPFQGLRAFVLTLRSYAAAR